MVNNYNEEDTTKINELGTLLNSNFKKLFHIENLPETENILVYKKEGELLGFLHYSKIYETIEIQNIIVDKKWRNHGIATSLLEHLIINNEENSERIILEVNENNIEAIKFYTKHNFKEIKRRPKYYKNEDALIMEKVLWKKTYTY